MSHTPDIGPSWRRFGIAIALGFLPLEGAMASDEPIPAGAQNLLLNPTFEFHPFTPHREARGIHYSSHQTAFWNTDQWGDITVMREAVAPETVRPARTAGNLVLIRPGKRLAQFLTLPDARLSHGDAVSLLVEGYQSESNALQARLKPMKLDSEDGAWQPIDFGLEAKTNTYPKFSRGELTPVQIVHADSPQTGAVTLAIQAVTLEGRFQTSKTSSANDINTIGLEVEFANAGKKDVWIWSPALVKGPRAYPGLPCARAMTPWYRHLPRTIQKLWKGEALHILVMGSSSDRGSANPALFVYDENPASPTFKQPLSSPGKNMPRIDFEADKVGRPDLKPYVGWVQHYFMAAGRLRTELMRKFNLPAGKICINLMAVDGGNAAGSLAALASYCSLSQPPNAWINGQGASATTWRELHPDLFTRADGPGPDLVIVGGGHNRRNETNDVALFEGAIRWIQRRYPHAEFLFSMHCFDGGLTSNPGDLQALSLRYQIPMLDFVKPERDLTRWCNRYALVPPDGHPQAAAHYLWFKTIEPAFECWDPILPGIAQLALPERVHPDTYGLEGDAIAFTNGHPRLRGGLVILEDSAFNLWANGGEVVVDGVSRGIASENAGQDRRKSSFSWFGGAFGERHILEIKAEWPQITALDAFVCPERRFIGVGSARWNRGRLRTKAFASRTGSPYGDRQLVLPPGAGVEIDPVATDLSVAYADDPEGGALRVLVDGRERLTVPTDRPFKTVNGMELFLENRKAVQGLGYGWHRVRLEAIGKPVRVLGLFAYDRRSNRLGERRLTGFAAGGDRVALSPSFSCRPVVICSGDLSCSPEDATPTSVTFTGGQGAYEIIGDGARIETPLIRANETVGGIEPKVNR